MSRVFDILEQPFSEQRQAIQNVFFFHIFLFVKNVPVPGRQKRRLFPSRRFLFFSSAKWSCRSPQRADLAGRLFDHCLIPARRVFLLQLFKLRQVRLFLLHPERLFPGGLRAARRAQGAGGQLPTAYCRDHSKMEINTA